MNNITLLLTTPHFAPWQQSQALVLTITSAGTSTVTVTTPATADMNIGDQGIIVCCGYNT